MKRGAVTGLPIDRIGETGEADFVIAGMRYAADLDRVFEVIMDAAQPVAPAAPLLDQ